MENMKNLKKLYLETYEDIKKLNIYNIDSEEEIINIILQINKSQSLKDIDINNFNEELISKIFRLSEDNLSNLFLIDKELYEIKFKLYIYLIDLVNQLCNIYSKNPLKRALVEPIVEALIESKTFLKIRLPLDEDKMNILNTHIGLARYKFGHISYVKIKEKDIDYIFEFYLLKCEKIAHGFELSKESGFLALKKYDEDIERNIFLNNLTFLLLKMHYKIEYFNPNLEFTDNPYYKNIISFYSEITNSNLNENKKEKSFKELLLNQFISTSNYLKTQKIIYLMKKFNYCNLIQMSINN